MLILVPAAGLALLSSPSSPGSGWLLLATRVSPTPAAAEEVTAGSTGSAELAVVTVGRATVWAVGVVAMVRLAAMHGMPSDSATAAPLLKKAVLFMPAPATA